MGTAHRCGGTSRPCSGAKGFFSMASILLAASFGVSADAMELSGNIDLLTLKNTFLGKFCFPRFSNEPVGSVRLHFRVKPHFGADPTNSTIYFMLFDDEDTSWPTAHESWETSSCEVKKSISKIFIEIPAREVSINRLISVAEEARPRFWYFTIVSCQNPSPDFNLEWKIHTTNSHFGWQSEISFEQRGIVIVYGVFQIFFGIAVVLLFFEWRGHKRQSFNNPEVSPNPYLKPLTISLVFSQISCWGFLIHYGVYLANGRGLEICSIFGSLAAVLADGTVFVLVVLASTGWGIGAPAKKPRLTCFGIFIGAFGMLGCISAFRSAVIIDESANLQNYQSGFGGLACVMKVVTFFLFVCQIRRSYQAEILEKTRKFYRTLGYGFSVWFLNLPVMIFLAYRVDPWERFRTVTTVEITIRFIGQALLAVFFCGSETPISSIGSYLGLPSGVVSSWNNEARLIGVSADFA
eukprot:TRINITY_DN30300_c0_g2_i1.p1 TRINITY_DN30300_c0_g2~~TRINITY_DN30300_c0_g2_i1.p1  ORF type:complete len:465 (+),score=48.96 TRINITY_DN30300_c0_g2_i1:123-1517(+)